MLGLAARVGSGDNVAASFVPHVPVAAGKFAEFIDIL